MRRCRRCRVEGCRVRARTRWHLPDGSAVITLCPDHYQQMLTTPTFALPFTLKPHEAPEGAS